jgi:hypothetical protein
VTPTRVSASGAPRSTRSDNPTKEDIMNIRFAIVRNADNAEKLYRYLPEAYSIAAGIDGDYLIIGVDVAGWTLDDYVIPRLASGTIQCVEVDAFDANDILRAAPDVRDDVLLATYNRVLAARLYVA